MLETRFLTVPRTARYVLRGNPDARTLWFVLHGYGQLAADFLAAFAPVDDGSRLFVAPEGLSRFYVRRDPDRVGASWMTREDRLHEIADYVRYLDAVYDEVMAERDRTACTVHVLGFSQGTATASRWFTLGQARIDRLILWAGALAHDLDPEDLKARLAPDTLTFVLGTQDEYIGAERLAEEEARLRAHAVPYRLLLFDGPHRLDTDTLKRVAEDA
ncbi:MAG: esterase [Rhodothermaceae bacterium]|nr:MAG: esterase [Rhodothermaceae bacterium]